MEPTEISQHRRLQEKPTHSAERRCVLSKSLKTGDGQRGRHGDPSGRQKKSLQRVKSRKSRGRAGTAARNIEPGAERVEPTPTCKGPKARVERKQKRQYGKKTKPPKCSCEGDARDKRSRFSHLGVRGAGPHTGHRLCQQGRVDRKQTEGRREAGRAKKCKSNKSPQTIKLGPTPPRSSTKLYCKSTGTTRRPGASNRRRV